jgi:hypothetical protein
MTTSTHLHAAFALVERTTHPYIRKLLTDTLDVLMVNQLFPSPRSAVGRKVRPRCSRANYDVTEHAYASAGF